MSTPDPEGPITWRGLTLDAKPYDPTERGASCDDPLNRWEYSSSLATVTLIQYRDPIGWVATLHADNLKCRTRSCQGPMQALSSVFRGAIRSCDKVLIALKTLAEPEKPKGQTWWERL